MTAARRPATVVLVHGYLANRFMLSPLAARLRGRGFEARKWGYWNIRCSLLVHAERFARWLMERDAEAGVHTLHLVTHSMGGIVARAALDRYRPDKLGRIVMLAPPNRGSFVATRAAPTFGRVLEPVRELSTAADSLVNSLPTPRDVDIGVIAAEWDALVTEESTRPHVPHAHTTVPTFHTGLLFRRDAADLIASFLDSGRFSPSEATAASP
ncbi:MAG: alpha/beta fold hydrolase [Planctomycetia bacterium]|nr:alpha/beta fold hydrolase [Planctomycetia bacterium]